LPYFLHYEHRYLYIQLENEGLERDQWLQIST
jgi:hypothetical protein